MKKDFIVVFSNKGARIVKGINVGDWKNTPNVLVNPDISSMRGIPPHQWKINGGVIEKTEDIAKSKLKEIHEYTIKPNKNYYLTLWLQIISISLITSLLVHYLI